MATTTNGKSDHSRKKKSDRKKQGSTSREARSKRSADKSLDRQLTDTQPAGAPVARALPTGEPADAPPSSAPPSSGPPAVEQRPASRGRAGRQQTDGKPSKNDRKTQRKNREPLKGKKKSQGDVFSPASDWDGWTRHLTKRRRPKPLHRRIGDRLGRSVRRPLSWGVPAEGSVRCLELIHTLDRVARGKSVDTARLAADLGAWLESGTSQPASPELGWEALAWAHALPQLAHELSADRWNELLEHLLQLSRDVQQSPLESSESASETRLLEHQLLAGELPLTLATLFPELKACRLLVEAASRQLSLGICDAVDGEGLPHAANLPSMRPLLACWIRCGYLDFNCFSDEARDQLRWLVRQTLRLCRADGSQLLCEPAKGPWCRPMFEAMLRLAGDAKDWAAAERILPKHAGKSHKGKLPDATVFSAWSEMAVMRCGWVRRAPLLAIRFDHPEMQFEINCDRQTLLGGAWQTQFLADGKSLEQDSQWEEVCWFSDKDIDYLELERSLDGSWRVQRQMLLSKQDGLLLLADALLGEQSARLECGTSWRLGDDVKVVPDEESREVGLQGRQGLFRVLPLALPEWHAESAEGELAQRDGHLHWRTQGHGRSLFHPLLIDFDKRRASKPLTWRRLTVAENRQIQSSDVAVGYRAQIGKPQWLIYRALSHRGNRTLLGQNFSQEFLMARFQRDGTCEPLIEIENE
jgi:hypothetical protein